MAIRLPLNDDVEVREGRFQRGSPGSNIFTEPHVARHTIDDRARRPPHGIAGRRNIARVQAFFCYEGGNEHF